MFSIDVVSKINDRQVSSEHFAEAIVKALAESLKHHLQPINIPHAQNIQPLPRVPPPPASESRNKPRLLGVRDAATILGLKASTIRSYIGRRKITVVRLGRRVLIPAETIEKIVNEGLPSPRSGLHQR